MDLLGGFCLMNPHPGMLVSFPPLKGASGSSYAMVVKATTPHIVQVAITADSGGRTKGSRFCAPVRRLTRRAKGQHRRSGSSAIWRVS